MSAKQGDSAGSAPPTGNGERQLRLKAALRENLKRRKDQARRRRTSEDRGIDATEPGNPRT